MCLVESCEQSLLVHLYDTNSPSDSNPSNSNNENNTTILRFNQDNQQLRMNLFNQRNETIPLWNKEQAIVDLILLCQDILEWKPVTRIGKTFHSTTTNNPPLSATSPSAVPSNQFQSTGQSSTNVLASGPASNPPEPSNSNTIGGIITSDSTLLSSGNIPNNNNSADSLVNSIHLNNQSDFFGQNPAFSAQEIYLNFLDKIMHIFSSSTREETEKKKKRLLEVRLLLFKPPSIIELDEPAILI